MLKSKSAKIVPSGQRFVAVPLQENFFDFVSSGGSGKATFSRSKISIEIEGSVSAKIYREGKLVTLLDGAAGKSLKVSGEVKASDIFIIGEKSFFESFKEDNLKSLSQSSNPDDLGKQGPLMISFSEVAFLGTFEAAPKSKKTTFSVGVILLVILAISVGFGIKQKKDKEKQALIAQRELELKQAEERGSYVVNPELFLDLTLLSSGFKGDTLSTSEGNLFVLDKASKKIVSIEIGNKKSKVVAGPDKIEEAMDLASYDDRVFYLATDGVKEVGPQVKTAINKDWEGEALIYAFAGNLYVLDKGAGAIYRYAGSDEVFGSKQNWLAESSKPDFSGAKSWVIDGAVYVLTTSGKILKFSRGSPQSFSLPSEVSVVDAIYSGDETQYFYVLGKSQKKVFVLAKNGEYKAQYGSDAIGEATSLVVSEADKKIILLTGGKLLSIEMRHL